MPVEPPAPSDEANIVLTGFMGTGKSTVGRLVAERLGRRFVDTDALIESRHGSIPRLFADHGEAHFRQLEREVADELAATSGAVVATGGRTMLDPANQATLGATGIVVCLAASPEALITRLRDEAGQRPLLQGDDPAGRIAALLAEREAGYARFPQVSTDGRTPEEVADAVIALATGAP
ncbi:shikimate kinase [Acidimicrobiia bacterium EGI L10123]|uniref:shikimate kinase n=1 Tax=Salinilacustrithrix flava TaxID=2957203 RepID=UPI003D7C199C|nr:shikimate kinase [Acidimicrobiia bacterium EGI L10123]